MIQGVGTFVGDGHPGVRRDPFLVPGTVIVAYLLATGRWGSYLGLPGYPVYISDVALVMTVGWLLLRHRRAVTPARRVTAMLAPLVALLAWSAVRLLLGRDLSLVAVRDAAPYAYAAVAFVPAMVPTGNAAKQRTLQVLTAALLVHLLWVSVSVLKPSLSDGLPLVGGRVHLLAVRQDFDGAVLAMVVGLAIHQVLSGSRRALRALALAVCLWSSWLVLELANRAALLALVVSVILVLAVDRSCLRGIPRRHLAPAAVLLLVAVIVILPQSSVYHRLAGAPEFVNNPAAATQQSRVWAWQDVLDYMNDSPARMVLGVGFGPDYVWISGASRRLEGPGNFGVRAPHSYPLNGYARLGLVGVSLLLWLLAVWARACRTIVRQRTRETDADNNNLLLLAVLVGSTLAVTSTVGVILESPFGAAPFFWAVGLVIRTSATALAKKPEVNSQQDAFYRSALP